MSKSSGIRTRKQYPSTNNLYSTTCRWGCRDAAFPLSLYLSTNKFTNYTIIFCTWLKLTCCLVLLLLLLLHGWEMRSKYVCVQLPSSVGVKICAAKLTSSPSNRANSRALITLTYAFVGNKFTAFYTYLGDGVLDSHVLLLSLITLCFYREESICSVCDACVLWIVLEQCIDGKVSDVLCKTCA